MFALVLLGSAISVLTAILLVHQLSRPHNFPPGPRWLPLLGNLLDLKRLVRKLGSQHAAFEALCEEHGTAVLGLRLGSDLVVVASGFEAVTEVLTSDAFLGRPDNFFMRLRTMGTRKGITTTDGALWSEQRRFAVRHFRQLGYGKVHMEELILAELKDLLSELDPAAEQATAVSLGPLLPPSVLNVLWALTAGTRFPHGDPRLQRLLDLMSQRGKAFDMAGGVLGTLPWLRHLAPERTGYNLLTRLNASLKELLEETIAAHHASYTQGRTRDLIDAYLHEVKAHQSEGVESTFTDEQLVMVCLDMFLAGSYTTSNTLNFALMLMVLHPDIQSKCFKDIYNNVEKGRLPSLTDRQKFGASSQAPTDRPSCAGCTAGSLVVLYSRVPSGRAALSDTTLAGHNIPQGTVVLINTHSIHHDRKYWKDPHAFRPERFLNAKGKIQPDERLLNFGLGKRRCLGDALARNCLFLFFTGMLQRFRLSVPPGETPPSREPVPGLTQCPQPYRVLLTPRTACPGSPRTPRNVSPLPGA
ncbi:probable cytochrome P450 305a1 [Thrips palmi]|uniref:Probable cytochrome P450 305a1 n=1 Tax=Thrips palmi TaxID=161013 RepID=A0A6P9AAZ5_THRPL|nr:probable cytochrome P450 305a1 [Thrips palmi]